MIPQQGRLLSSVLDLELSVEQEKLRFSRGLALLPDPGDLLVKLRERVGELEQQMDNAERHAEEAERALAEALAEIDRLKRERP